LWNQKLVTVPLLDWQERLAMGAGEIVEFEISCRSEKSFQDVRRADVQITEGPLVLDEVFNGGSEFH
jgi:hypothetical protein